MSRIEKNNSSESTFLIKKRGGELRKLISIIFLSTIAMSSKAETKVFTCASKETNFVTTYSIDFENKSITHLTSISPNTNQKFPSIGNLRVLSFNNDYSISVAITNDGKIINILLFDFKNKIYTISGHYVNEKRKPNSQYFECSTN